MKGGGRVYNLEDTLQHYGVKGMKWGVIRKRKSESAEVTKAKNEVSKRKADHTSAKRKLNSTIMPSGKLYDDVANTQRELKYAKQDLSSIKILNKLKEKGKSDLQIKTEAKYKKKGMSNDEAAVAAYKNIRTKKIFAAAAVTTLAVGGAYAAYKIRDSRVDKIIKSGTKLQNITADSDMGIRDAFYSATNKLDKAKYKGLYGGHLKAKHGAAFKKEVKVLTDIKQASPKNAQKVLEDLVKSDDNFARELRMALISKERSGMGPQFMAKAKKAHMSLANGKVDKNVYETLNIGLVDHSPDMQKVTDGFFKALSNKGYNAIKDVNDVKYSGYNSLNPIISFGTNGKVKVVDVKKLAQDEIKKNENIGMGAIIGTDIIKKGALAVGSFNLAATASTAANNKVTSRKVAKYRSENPNTKLSYNEIARMIERSE